MDSVKCKANYSRVCQLLVDKGGDALRDALHVVYPPSTLAVVLNTNKRTLSRIRYSVINATQWNLLYPASGTPDSRNFDVTLLTILLRNICGLPSPPTGWNVMPAASDTSISANIARIKIFRNDVYGHTPSAQLDDTTFETLWQEISKPLVKLGIPQQDIDELKETPLSPEEESYIEKLKEWKELDDNLLSKLNDLEMGVLNVGNLVLNVGSQVVNVENRVLNVENQVHQLRMIVENLVPSQVDQLAKLKSDVKCELLELISDEFAELPNDYFLKGKRGVKRRSEDKADEPKIEMRRVKDSNPILFPPSESPKKSEREFSASFKGTKDLKEINPVKKPQLRKSIRHREKIQTLEALKEENMTKLGPPVKCFAQDKGFLLGKGSMGTYVYLGILEDGSQVAVKRMLKESCHVAAQNEMRILSLINAKNSPFIVSYRHFLKDNTFVYLIVDLCEQTLDEYVCSEISPNISQINGRRMIKEVLTGLEFLHDQGILHRDLKPSNVLVDVDGHMRLADFGISRVLNKDETTLHTHAQGTEGWMAAEVIESIGKVDKGRLTKKSDVQPAGMIAFFILTKGEHPFGTTVHRMTNIVNGNPVNLNNLDDFDARKFVSLLICRTIHERPSAREALSLSFLDSID